MLFDDGMPGFFDLFPWKLLIFILIVCVVRAYFKGASFKERVTAKNLVVVLTGGNVGIGKQIIRELNQRGAKVYMLCRDKERGIEGKSQLVQLGCNTSRLELRIVDLTSFKSIRKFASEFATEEERLDVLICNAGIMLFPKFKLTEDGHEWTWQTNFLGHALLTQLLMPMLKKSSQARIINVSALAHFYADAIDLNNIDRRENWDSRQSYAKSKLAQVMYTRELARRLRRDGCETVTVNACHPGICYTRIIRHTPIGNNSILKTCTAPFLWFFAKTPKDGAQTPLFLALSPKVAGISGKYFSEMTEKPASDFAMNDAACQQLYDYCHTADGGAVSDKE